MVPRGHERPAPRPSSPRQAPDSPRSQPRRSSRGTASSRGVQDIPVDAIKGTTEPNRAGQFDYEFRPTTLTRCRWLSVWLANHRGTTLPPISVVPVSDGYAIRDGHHRVSVARARGAVTIDATVDAA